MRMARVNITMPDELYRQARQAGLNVSQLVQLAVAAELQRRAKIAELDAYLAELDRIATAYPPPAPAKKNTKAWRDWERSAWKRKDEKQDRAGRFARWNSLLLAHLDEDRAARLAGHAAFGGPEADFLRARAARQRGDIDQARSLVAECLKQHRRNDDFKSFAAEIGVEITDGGGSRW